MVAWNTESGRHNAKGVHSKRPLFQEHGGNEVLKHQFNRTHSKIQLENAPVWSWPVRRDIHSALPLSDSFENTNFQDSPHSDNLATDSSVPALAGPSESLARSDISGTTAVLTPSSERVQYQWRKGRLPFPATILQRGDTVHSREARSESIKREQHSEYHGRNERQN